MKVAIKLVNPNSGRILTQNLESYKVNHLKKNLNYENDPAKKFEIIKSDLDGLKMIIYLVKKKIIGVEKYGLILIF